MLALSKGHFSLALAENEEFEVIDHANADARRHIRTLSGGETFLASLALALALADSIAMVAAGRTARLEAIFLDEGFGTLDPETLDVVATAIEELSASGRMVGLVTHVGELAARMPVRFEVRRGPRGSTVERVEA
jgi:exonuclease SbcC